MKKLIFKKGMVYKMLMSKVDKLKKFIFFPKIFLLFIVLNHGCDEEKGGPNGFLPRFTIHCWCPAWSPDGKTIAFGYVPWIRVDRDSFIEKWDSSGIFFIDADGKNKRPFLLAGINPPLCTPEFSPDGKWLTFIGSGPGGTHTLFKAKINGDSIIPLTFSDKYENFVPKWAPDGKKILFWRYNVMEPQDSSGLCLINADGSKIKMIYKAKSLGEWGGSDFLPDYRIVFKCYINNKNAIWITDTTGLNIQMISDFQGTVANCSPCGKKVLLTTYNSSTMRFEIWVMNIDGTNVKRLCIDGVAPAWSPDGTKIVYVKYNYYLPATKYPGYGELWIMDADGSNERQLTYPD